MLTLPSQVHATPGTDTLVRVGVLAHRGHAQALARWQLTADYLSAKIQGYQFEITPLDLNATYTAVQNGKIDFILTNPGNYADLEARFGISRIATLQTREGNQTLVRYGAVIITRADNTRIQSLADLKDKSFMAVSQDAFGGFQMAWREMVEHGIDPFKDLRELHFAGFPQDKIVHAVAEAEVDAATVRAETFAQMVKSGIIDKTKFRILNQQDNSGSPFAVSTRLYPEWPFATLKHTPRQLATQVTQALLSLESHHPATLAARSAGWTIPLDYSPVTELMYSLKIGPYAALRETSLLEIIKRYAYWLIGASILLLSLIILTGYISRTNQRLRETERDLRKEIKEREISQAALANYRDSLEAQVIKRTHDLRMTNQALEKSRVALHKLVQIASAPELNHQQRLQQLLETGRRYFDLDVAVLAQDGDDKKRICTTSGNTELIPETYGSLNQDCASYLANHKGNPLDIPDVGEDSTCNQLGWRSYLGVGVILDGHIQYTLEFAGTKPRQARLSQWDNELLKVMAQWIADELERHMAIESQRRHESEFARVSRLSTIGEMAASLAHELNQPLTGTINYSNSCLRMLKETDPDMARISQGLEQAVKGATMTADILRHIRLFVQKGEEQYSEISINLAARNASSLISHEIQRHDLKLIFDLEEDIPPIKGNLIQLEQVILNFIRNGLEAMDRVDKQNHRLAIKTQRTDAGMVRLVVTDTGEGIKQDVLPKIFDAFFSTKIESMGIGLSISRSIIESHQGRISARSLERGGTEFSFELPVAAES